MIKKLFLIGGIFCTAAAHGMYRNIFPIVPCSKDLSLPKQQLFRHDSKFTDPSVNRLSSLIKQWHLQGISPQRDFCQQAARDLNPSLSSHKKYISQQPAVPWIASGLAMVAIATAYYLTGSSDDELPLDIADDPDWMTHAREFLEELRNDFSDKSLINDAIVSVCQNDYPHYSVGAKNCILLKTFDNVSDDEVVNLLLLTAQDVAIYDVKQKKQFYRLMTIIRAGYQQGFIAQADIRKTYEKLCKRLYWNHRCATTEAEPLVTQALLSVLDVYFRDFPTSCALTGVDISKKLWAQGVTHASVSLLARLYSYNPEEAVEFIAKLKQRELLDVAQLVFKDSALAKVCQSTPLSEDALMENVIQRFMVPPQIDIGELIDALVHFPIHLRYQDRIAQVILCMPFDYHEAYSGFLKSSSPIIQQATCDSLLALAKTKHKQIRDDVRLRYITFLFERDPKKYKAERTAILDSLFKQGTYIIKMMVLEQFFTSTSHHTNCIQGYHLLADYLGLPTQTADEYIANNMQCMYAHHPCMMFESDPCQRQIIEFLFKHPNVSDAKRYDLLQQKFMHNNLSWPAQEEVYKRLYTDQKQSLYFRQLAFIDYMERVDFNKKSIQEALETDDALKAYVNAINRVIDSSYCLQHRIESVHAIAHTGIGWNALIRHFNKRNSYEERDKLNLIESLGIHADKLVEAAFCFFKTDQSDIVPESHWLTEYGLAGLELVLMNHPELRVQFVNTLYAHRESLRPDMIDFVEYEHQQTGIYT